MNPDALNHMRSRRKQRQRTPMPWSGEYEAMVAGANRERDFNDTDLTAQEQETRKSYGFEDSSDPFSRARTLQEQFQNANRGTTNNYAAGGQLYAGSRNNAYDIDRENFERGWDTEQKNYASDLNAIAQRRLQSSNDYQDTVGSAQAQALADAVSERVDPREAPKKRKNRRR